MSEQHNPARTPLGPETSRWRKLYRNKDQGYAAADFRRGEQVVCVIKQSNGFEVHVLGVIVDVYDSKLLSYWSSRNRPHVYVRVLDVSHPRGEEILRRILKVSLDRSYWTHNGEARLTDLPLTSWDGLKGNR